MQALNSLVLLFGSVAVAETTAPGANVIPVKVVLKATLPLASVETIAESRNNFPSPRPVVVLHASLEKNSSLKVVFAVLFRVPCMLVFPPPLFTAYRYIALFRCGVVELPVRVHAQHIEYSIGVSLCGNGMALENKDIENCSRVQRMEKTLYLFKPN